jgi:hypothetical protein
MDRKLRLLLVGPNDCRIEAREPPTRRRPFSIEIDRQGVFVCVGQFDAYFRAERDTAWYIQREPDGFDAQVWRLHLIVGRVPR